MQVKINVSEWFFQTQSNLVLIIQISTRWLRNKLKPSLRDIMLDDSHFINDFLSRRLLVATVLLNTLLRVLKSHNYFIHYYVISILMYLHINFIFSSQTSSLFVIWRYVWDNIKEHNTEYNQQHFTRYTDYVRIYFHIHKCGWYLASCLQQAKLTTSQALQQGRRRKLLSTVRSFVQKLLSRQRRHTPVK